MVGYDDYILFVLGVNNNALSCLIRSHLRSTDDMYGMYQKCQRIAEEFSIYDGNRPNISQLDNYYAFVAEYEQELYDYVCDDADDFRIKE